MPWNEGHIVVGRVSGLVIRPGVDPENAEIGIVARPHPVIGVATEFADRTGRGAHQSHIPEGLGDDEVVAVAVIERAHHCLVMRALGGHLDDGF